MTVTEPGSEILKVDGAGCVRCERHAEQGKTTTKNGATTGRKLKSIPVQRSEQAQPTLKSCLLYSRICVARLLFLVPVLPLIRLASQENTLTARLAPFRKTILEKKHYLIYGTYL